MDLLQGLWTDCKVYGLIARYIYSNDNLIDITDIEGLKLSSLCSRYHGAVIGGALFGGGEGFTVMNFDQVRLRSSVTEYGVQVNLAYKNLKVECLDMKENKNWNKTVRF